MSCLGRVLSILLVTLLTLSGLIMVEFVSAQAIPKPSVPEFTLKYVDNSYDVPPTYGTDAYTGRTIIIQAGYYVQNISIEFIIKNSPFTTFKDTNGNLHQFMV